MEAMNPPHDSVVTMEHVRLAHYCLKGVREFCSLYNLDYQDFKKNGISFEKLEATQDQMALNLIRIAKNVDRNT